MEPSPSSSLLALPHPNFSVILSACSQDPPILLFCFLYLIVLIHSSRLPLLVALIFFLLRILTPAPLSCLFIRPFPAYPLRSPPPWPISSSSSTFALPFYGLLACPSDILLLLLILLLMLMISPSSSTTSSSSSASFSSSTPNVFILWIIIIF